MLPISFNVQNVPRRHLGGDVQLVRPEPYRHLVYTGRVADDQVPVSFVGMTELSPANLDVQNLNELIEDISVFENSMLGRQERVEPNRVFRPAVWLSLDHRRFKSNSSGVCPPALVEASN